MFDVHLLDGQNGNKSGGRIDPAICDHGDWLSSDGDAIRCCRCLSLLIMMPAEPGEFRLEWLSPGRLGKGVVQCAA